MQECNFHAIVEFPDLFLSFGLNDPTKWHVGLVQNMLAGSGINYIYSFPNQAPATVATARSTPTRTSICEPR